MKTPAFKWEEGFTLVEVIVTLVVAAVLAVVLAAFTGTALQRAGEPAVRLTEAYALQQVMENITGYYVDLIHGNDALTVLYNAIADEDTNPATGFGAYKATKSWVKYTGSPPVETAGATSDMLKIVLEPVSGDSAIKLTAFFAR